MRFDAIKSAIASGLKSSGFKTFAAFAGSNFIVSIIQGVGGLLQARWVSPDVFGEFQKYGILTTYLGICILVVNDGLIRQYPYYIGKGEKEKALEIAGAAKWWFILIAWLLCCLFGGLSVGAALRGDWRAVCGWSAQIFVTIGSTYGIFLGIMYRTSNDFRRLASNNLIGSVIAFGALGAVRVFGYFGIAFRASLMPLVGVCINRYYLPVKVKAVFDLKKLLNLASISLKFSLPAYFHASFLLASRRALILLYCFQSGLGLYSFAAVLIGFLRGFSTALSQILNVKIITKFGATEDIWQSFKASLRSSLFGFAMSVALIAVSWFMIPIFVHWFTPKYIDAIPCFRVLSFSLLTGALALPLLVFKAALMWKTAAAQAISNFSTTVILIWLLPKTIVMVAVASVAGGIAECLVGYGVLAYKYFTRKRP